jgi:FtsH-binding integral membrane protein
MDYNNIFLLTIITTFILIILTYKLSFKNNKPTCNNFLNNVYLYLALSFSIIGCFMHIFNYIVIPKNNRYKLVPYLELILSFIFIYIISVIVLFISMYLLSRSPLFSKSGYIMNHGYWLLALASFSIILYPYFKSIEYSEILIPVLFITTLIFLVMSLVVYIFPNFFEKTYKIFMIGFMISLIVVILLELFIYFTKKFRSISNYLSYFVILLFSLAISYDTRRLNDYANKCINSPNYPSISKDLLLDIINIFVRLMSVYKK